MFHKYLDFEIQIVGSFEGYLLFVQSPGGDAQGRLLLPSDDSAYQRLLEQLAQLALDEEGAEALGRLLFQAVFHGAVRDVYIRSQGVLEAGQGIRLILNIDARYAQLVGLPWELMHDPDRGYLSLLDIPVLRYLPQQSVIPTLAIDPPLRVLLTSALPEPSAEPDHELQAVQEALAGLGDRVYIQVEPHLTWENLQRRLRENYHIWHFVGRAGTSEKSGSLIFEDAQHSPKPISAAKLGMLLNRSGVRLIVLDASESALLADAPLHGLAPALIRAQVPAVVAMQFAMPAVSSRAFAVEFYRALAELLPIDACVTEGRKAIVNVATLARPDWALPVVYSRAPDGQLFEALAPATKLDLPPEPPALPAPRDFVGRASECARYAEQLRSQHLVIVSGMPGVGKTALATALAAAVAPPSQIFWYAFSSSDGLDTMLWRLAAFLAGRGYPEIWIQLETARVNNLQPPAPAVLFDHVRQALRGKNFLLCLDDLHVVDKDPLFARFGELLLGETRNRSFDCIITTRAIPDFAHQVAAPPLEGLSDADARLFLSSRGLTITDAQFASLHVMTGGNAELLTLSVNALLRSSDLERSISRLEESDDIERYLLNEVDAGLSPSERELMCAIAVLLDTGGTREAIEALFDDRRVRRDLLSLSEHFLLNVTETDEGEVYRQHAIVQAFYYDELRKQERIDLHRRAAGFYEHESSDSLRAAIHYDRAGDQHKAAALVTANLPFLINQGRALALVQLLDRFSAHQLDGQQWIDICIARGRVYLLRRQQQQARSNYQEALKLLDALPLSPAVREQQALVFCMLGELLRPQKPAEALEWLRKGIAALDAIGAAEPTSEQRMQRGRLLATMGALYNDTGDYDLAAARLGEALSALPDAASQWRGMALNNLGLADLYRGDLLQAHENFDQARLIYEQFHSYSRIVSIWLNLGLIDDLRGAWPAAAENYLRALALSTTIGNVADQALAELNMGNLRAKQGDLDEALAHLSRCLDLTQLHDLVGLAAAAKSTLADIHVRLGDWEHVVELVEAAEQLVREAEANYVLPEIQRSRAQFCLANNDLPDARDAAQHSLDSARELNDPREQGISLRVLGQVLAAMGAEQLAIAAFEQSLELLEGRDRFEAARAMRVFGQNLTASGAVERGTRLIVDAQATFQELGARLDAQSVGNLTETSQKTELKNDAPGE